LEYVNIQSKDPKNRLTYQISGKNHVRIQSFQGLERRKRYVEALKNPKVLFQPRKNEKRRFREDLNQHGEDKFLRCNVLHLGLKELNLLNNKHIPEIYMNSSRAIRLALLAGLLDSDGHLSWNQFEISQKRFNLADDIIKLAKSLGFFVSSVKCVKKATNSSTHMGTEVMRLMISGLLLNEIPTLVSKKKVDPEKCKFRYLPKIAFGNNTPSLKRKRRLTWTSEDEKQLIDAFQTHGKKWAKIRDDINFGKIAKEKNFTTRNIMDRIKRLKMD